MQSEVVVPPSRPNRFRAFLFVTFLVGAAFLGGYVPQRLDAGRAKEALAALQAEHELTELHRQLGVASLEAMRSNYASAADAARLFFDGCTEYTRTHTLENEPRTRTALSAYAASRDEVLQQLAAADPAVRERLGGMFLAMNGVIARRQ